MSTHTEDGVLRLQQFIIPEIPPTPQISVKASNEPLKQTFAKSGNEVLKQTISKEIPPISQIFVKSNDVALKQTITPEVPLVKQTFIISDNNESLKQYIVKDNASGPSFPDLNKALEEENVDLKRQILDFSSSNANLTKRVTNLEVYIAGLETKKDEDNSSLYDQIKKLQEKVTTLQRENTNIKKDSEEKKALELKCRKLSVQNSDFEKVLFLEKGKLEKERVEYEKEMSSFEAKNAKLSKKISELQKELDIESQELEKMKKADFQARSVKEDFSSERKIFQQEIHKLTKNLAVLSTDIMKEKLVKSDILKELNLVNKERNDLSYKVKSLNKSKCYSECPIRPSNLFYDHSVDNSSKNQYADLPVFKRVKMEWRVKGTTPVKEVPKSKVPTPNAKKNNAFQGKSFVKPDLVYSVNQLIRFAQKKICCSYCGTNDFIHKDYAQYWYGTYSIPFKISTPNTLGPKSRWVPKSA